MANLKTEHIVAVRDMDGELVQVFGNDVPPTDEDIKRCLEACKEQGGVTAFIDTIYSLEE